MAFSRRKPYPPSVRRARSRAGTGPLSGPATRSEPSGPPWRPAPRSPGLRSGSGKVDAGQAGIVDNDWIELYNANGALTARAVVSQRVNPGMCLMYHAQEKIVNVPGSEITHQRGGIHNSVTRTVLKPRT